MRVVLTHAAERDLWHIHAHIAADDPKAASRFLGELRTACASLSDHPERYPIVPRYAQNAIRRRVHGNYLIFYRVGMTAVEIIHVLHGAMDFDQFL